MANAPKSPAPAQPLLDKDFALPMESPRRALEDLIHWLATHWLNVAVSVAFAVGLYILLDLARHYGRKLGERSSNIVGSIACRAISRTWRLFLALIAIRMVIGYANPPEWLRDTIRILFTVVSTFQVAIWLREIVLGLIERNTDPAHETLNNAMGIIRLLVTVALFAIAIVVVLDNIGVNVTGLVAGLGIGGIAIGLAAQGIFSDLFAALSIIFDKPFRQGEMIKYENTTARVERIGLKSTRLRAVTGERKIISNANLLQKEITSLQSLAQQRVHFDFGVIYQTPVEKLDRIPAMMRELVEAQKMVFAACGMTGFGSSSLDFMLEFDVPDPEHNDYGGQKHRMALAILRRFEEEGIKFAYPTQMSFTAAPDGQAIMPYPIP